MFLTNMYDIFTQMMVAENDRIRGKIPPLFSNRGDNSPVFATLMEPHLERVDKTISPGLTLLRWSSLNIDSYLQEVGGSLRELELLVERVSHTLEFQIEGVLQDIQCTKLCDLPDSDPWTVNEFVNRTQVGNESLHLSSLVHVYIHIRTHVYWSYSYCRFLI